MKETFDEATGEEIVVLYQEEYRDMMKEIRWLNALREAGVHDWEGIDAAIEIYEGMI